MKEFKSLQETSKSEKSLPSEAMTFNGIVLEEEINGYQTLSVTGRELIGYNVQNVAVDGLDGANYQSARLPSRNITVRYQLKAETAESLREKFNQMNQILKEKQAVISFMDEPEYEFIGTLGAVDGVPEGVLSLTSAFEIVCADPYKYKISESVTGTGSVEITQSLAEPVVVEEIIVNNTDPVEQYTIENNDLAIRLTGTSESTSEIAIYPKTQEIIRNNTDRPDLLEWTSDFENFEVSTGDIVTVQPETSEITVRVRERLR